MRRDGVRRPDRIERVCRNIPVYYMVFDILYLNGRWVTDCPLAERQRLLADILRPHPHVHVVDNEPDAQALFQAVQARDMEGVVVKDLRSTYRIGGKDGRWRKKKWYRDRVVVVGGLVLRGGRAASLLLGLFDAQGRLWYIGHAGTGRLSERAWRELTADLLACRQAQPAFVNPPRTADVVWLRPVSTVRIIYTEWAQGHTLRQASVQSPVTVEAALCRLQPNDPVPGE
jgi:bifunctional non-homologous end joining protein LigD